jgi:sterol desaturase/sphingolipid hydroxylase (fatty acid hydroxylase superfamily)
MDFIELQEFIITKLVKTIKTLGLTSFNSAHFYFFLSSTAIAFGIEMLFVGWRKSSFVRIFNKSKGNQNDLFAWGVDAFNLFSALGFILTFGVCYFLAGKIGRYIGFDLGQLISNEYLNFLVIFIFSDFTNYCKHYVLHSYEPLWHVHSFHHSSEELNIITGNRGNFIEGEIAKFFEVLPFVIFGVPFNLLFYV